MKRDHSVVFETAPNYCISDSCWPRWRLHFSWGIPARSSGYNGHLSWIHPFQSILVRWFLECRHSLSPSRLTTSNLPWSTDLTFQVRMRIALYSIGPCFYHQSHPQLGAVFTLSPSLHSFWSYFSTDLQEHTGHLLAWGVFSVISFCLFILFMGFSRQEYWSGLPFPSPVDHILSEISTMTRLSWVAPHIMP